MQSAFGPYEHVYEWPDWGVRVVISHFFRVKSGELRAEVHTFVGGKKVGHSSAVLGDQRGRFWLETEAKRRSPRDLPWIDIYFESCVASLEYWRKGSEVEDIAMAESAGVDRWVVDPIVTKDDITILFADGGSGKSLMSLALGLTVASGRSIVGMRPGTKGRVLYLDWEDSINEHGDRLRALARGCANPFTVPAGEFLYRRESEPITERVEALSKVVVENDIQLVIVDSVGLARGGDPESQGATLAMFNAIRRLNTTALCIDHVSKAELEKEKPSRPFGSVYTNNTARAAWHLSSEMQENEDEYSKYHLTLRKTKSNSKYHPPMGFNVEVWNQDQRIHKATYSKVGDPKVLPSVEGQASLPMGNDGE